MLDLKQMEQLTSKCVKLAKDAWRDTYNPGSGEHEAVSRLAAEILEYYLEQGADPKDL